MFSSKQIRRWTASTKNPTDEFELTPLIESPAVPRIRRIPTMLKEEPGGESNKPGGESNKPGKSNNEPGGESNDEPGGNRLPQLKNKEASKAVVKNEMKDSILRFGPLFTVDQPSVQATKDKAWDHVLKKSLELKIDDDDEGVIKEIYLTAIRKVEKQAKEAYYDSKAAVAVAGSTFRWMMIKDGCFFLQLVFVILGCAEHLGYAPNDPIFGKRRKTNNRDQFKKWIESMFYVGNQVPLVVLESLMSQKFFQGVIAAAAAKGGLGSGPPPGLSKKVLYDVIILPALQRQVLVGQKQKTTTVALDLLHGLQSLVMGPKPPPSSPTAPRQYLRNNVDLEANYEDDDIETGEYEEEDEEINKRRIFFPCATELEQAGIRFTKLESGVGARGIRLRSWYMNMWASICLPVLPIDGNTETLLRNLKTYEACDQKLGKDGREVESYLKLMSDLVQTAKDARLLTRRGIIADIGDVDRLPRILRRLSSDDGVRLTHEFSRLRRHIRNYSSPWAYYKNFMSIVLVLTLMQTFFATLAYFRPP